MLTSILLVWAIGAVLIVAAILAHAQGVQPKPPRFMRAVLNGALVLAAAWPILALVVVGLILAWLAAMILLGVIYVCHVVYDNFQLLND